MYVINAMNQRLAYSDLYRILFIIFCDITRINNILQNYHIIIIII